MATTNTSPKNVENLMLKKGLISKEQLDKAKMIQHQTRERLEDIIIRLGFLTERQILDLWAETLNTSVVDLTNIKVDAKLIAIIPEDKNPNKNRVSNLIKISLCILDTINSNKLILSQIPPFFLSFKFIKYFLISSIKKEKDQKVSASILSNSQVLSRE